jgi:hypothetical protein
MADASPLAGLLDRAGHVFHLAWRLGRTFQDERGTGGGLRQLDPTSWARIQPAFNEFWDALLDLRGAMQNPPDGFGPVAQALMKAAGVAKQIREAMQTPEGQGWAEFLDFFPDLNSVAVAGHEAIQQAPNAQKGLATSPETKLLQAIFSAKPTAETRQPILEEPKVAAKNILEQLSRLWQIAACATNPTDEDKQNVKAWLDVELPAIERRKSILRMYERPAIKARGKGGVMFALGAGPRFSRADSALSWLLETVERVIVFMNKAGWHHFWDGAWFSRLAEALELEPDAVEMIYAEVFRELDSLVAAESGASDGSNQAVTNSRQSTQSGDTGKTSSTDANAQEQPGDSAYLALIRVFTNGIADDRIEKATRLLADDKLTANEKLTKIDALIRFPATASAEQLGEMLGVTKQAVWKTDWWIQNRKGEKESEVGRRREGHRKRAKTYEPPGHHDEDG